MELETKYRFKETSVIVKVTQESKRGYEVSIQVNQKSIVEKYFFYADHLQILACPSELFKAELNIKVLKDAESTAIEVRILPDKGDEVAEVFYHGKKDIIPL